MNVSQRGQVGAWVQSVREVGVDIQAPVGLGAGLAVSVVLGLKDWRVNLGRNEISEKQE